MGGRLAVEPVLHSVLMLTHLFSSIPNTIGFFFRREYAIGVSGIVVLWYKGRIFTRPKLTHIATIIRLW